MADRVLVEQIFLAGAQLGSGIRPHPPRNYSRQYKPHQSPGTRR